VEMFFVRKALRLNIDHTFLLSFTFYLTVAAFRSLFYDSGSIETV
jgi:hypothetical protein